MANGLIALVKLIASGVAGSSAMVPERFHSVADTGNHSFLPEGAAVSRLDATLDLVDLERGL